MRKKLLLLGLIAVIVGVVASLEPGRFRDLGILQERLGSLQAEIADRPLVSATAFFTLYVAATALSLPGAAILTIAAGALFGLVTGTLLASFASAIGGTAAFWSSRYFFRDSVERRFAEMLRRINRGLAEDGAYYLFAIRLVPLIPFFALNLVMGLTRLRTRTYYWVSQLGMLPVTVVYANAGTQLSRLGSAADILSPAIAGSLALLAVFPLLARRLTRLLRARRRYATWSRPARYEANLVVIGTGSAALATAREAAAVRARVVLIDTGTMRAAEAVVDLADVACVRGDARITSPWTVTVDGRTITTRSIVVATGSRPAAPPVPGLETVPYLTPDTIGQLPERPGHLLVLGAGAAGCELAQAFGRKGSEVTLVDQQARLVADEEPDASAALLEGLLKDGVRVLLRWRAERFCAAGGGGILEATDCATGMRHEIAFDRVLVATGRVACTADLGLEALSVDLNPDGTIATNEFQQTTYPNIFACGEVARRDAREVGIHQAWSCAMNALYGRFWRFRVDDRAISRVICTDPEIARAGLTESAAADEGMEVKCVTYRRDDLDPATAGSGASGFVKVLTPLHGDRIFGATIVGPRAGDIIGEFVLAMRHRLGLRRIPGTGHAHPASTKADKSAAGEWRRPRLADSLLRVAEWLHRRQRGGDW